MTGNVWATLLKGVAVYTCWLDEHELTRHHTLQAAADMRIR